MIRSIYITYMGLTEPLLYSQSLNYIKDLSEKGIAFRVLSFEKREFLTKGNLNKIKKELDELSIKWSFLIYHKKWQLISKPYDIIRGILFVIYLSIRERINVIHVRGTLCAIMGSVSKGILGQKMIFDMRGLMAEEYADAGIWRRNSAIYKVVDTLEKYFMEYADELIVLTHKIKKILENKYTVKNITVIPTCTDLERFNINNPSDYLKSKYPINNKFVMIYTGSIGTWYMLPEMIDFYRKLMQAFADPVFIILSQTKKEFIVPTIPAEMKESVIVESAHPDKVADFLNMANVGISFIKPCFSKIASFPTKLGEYLACGLPVAINSGIGDTEEIVKENRVGVVIENFSIEEYKKRIDELRELLREGEALKKRCRSVAERHLSLKEGVESYQRVYARLAAN
ncbi:MAG: glycosyltransferase [Candidatus Omnitrophica bacterium]|nr:glycosyltransferase [Candidatus Omnitrophota bacterium]